jgi:hypothetical protein
MTAAFLFQAVVALSADRDTMNHNYYMYKQPRAPWAVILCDADQAFSARREILSMDQLHGGTYKENAFFREGGTMAPPAPPRPACLTTQKCPGGFRHPPDAFGASRAAHSRER